MLVASQPRPLFRPNALVTLVRAPEAGGPRPCRRWRLSQAKVHQESCKVTCSIRGARGTLAPVHAISQLLQGRMPPEARRVRSLRLPFLHWCQTTKLCMFDSAVARPQAQTVQQQRSQLGNHRLAVGRSWCLQSSVCKHRCRAATGSPSVATAVTRGPLAIAHALQQCRPSAAGRRCQPAFAVPPALRGAACGVDCRAQSPMVPSATAAVLVQHCYKVGEMACITEVWQRASLKYDGGKRHLPP